MLKEQKGRFSKDELELMRNTFGDNDDLLYAVRNFFYGFDVDKDQLLLVNPKVMKLLEKSLLAVPEPEAPIYQMADPYLNLVKIQEMNPAVAILHIKAKDKQMAYVRQMFELLKGDAVKAEEYIDFPALKEAGGKDEETRYIDMLTYLGLMSYIDGRFQELQTLANKKDETDEEKAKRTLQNSNK